MNQDKKEAQRFSNEQILFLSIIAVLLAVILLLGITVARNQLTFKPAATLQERYQAQQIKKFEDVYNYITKYYVEEVDAQELLQAAMQGMADYLHDPYTGYVVDKDAMHLQETVQGNYGGIGASLRRDDAGSAENGVIIITTVYASSAADKAGLMIGDQIIAVDDNFVENLSLDEVVALLRGTIGSHFRLKVLRLGEIKELEIRREKVEVPTVFFDFISDGLGYIKITQFTPQTAYNLEKALQSMQKSGLSRLILDLRDNPGGELESVVQSTDLFLEKGLIVKTESRSDLQNKHYKADGNLSIDENIPIAVLINRNSASAAEVMAGSLQDLGRATVYGKRSFGKTSVQVVLSLGVNPLEYFKLTVAHYYTASGRNISTEGVIPDYEIDVPFTLSPEQLALFRELQQESVYQDLLRSSDSLESHQEQIQEIALEWQLPEDFLLWQIGYYRSMQVLPLPIFNLEYDYALAYVVEAMRSSEK